MKTYKQGDLDFDEICLLIFEQSISKSTNRTDFLDVLRNRLILIYAYLIVIDKTHFWLFLALQFTDKQWNISFTDVDKDAETSARPLLITAEGRKVIIQAETIS